MAELLRFYRRLPARGPEETIPAWMRRLGHALTAFEGEVAACYLEGTLLRLLHSSSAETRQAAVLALGRLATMGVNRALAAMLRDRDGGVRQLTAEALWSLWFRADSPENNQELQRLSGQIGRDDLDTERALVDFAALARRAPTFAEVFNQRAILFFRLGEWQRAIADCTRALRFNPCHFGAASGMAQCYLKLKKVRLALRAYRRAYQINPNLAWLQQAIRSLERLLGEEGKR
jgi:tetratricopeptide (TPR) repeat protein